MPYQQGTPLRVSGRYSPGGIVDRAKREEMDGWSLSPAYYVARSTS